MRKDIEVIGVVLENIVKFLLISAGVGLSFGMFILWLMKPNWHSFINLLISKYQINLAFTILSNVLQAQLPRVMVL